MMNKIIYEKKKREKVDKCNICGEITNLTWDHVPPKFCFNNRKIMYKTLLDIEENKKSRISQNGIKYRSICSRCNNDLLGSNYDKEYEKIVDKFNELYTSTDKIEQYIEIRGIKVNKLSRCIIGHLLAARNEYIDGKSENKLREYFLNTNLKPPKDLNLFYYVYRYSTIMIVRDFFIKKFGNIEYSIPGELVSCLNSFPIAFILSDKCECSSNSGLYDLFKLCTTNIDEEVNIKVDLFSYMYPNGKKNREPYWPCNVSDDETGTSIILFGDDENSSVFSQSRNLK